MFVVGLLCVFYVTAYICFFHNAILFKSQISNLERSFDWFGVSKGMLLTCEWTKKGIYWVSRWVRCLISQSLSVLGWMEFLFVSIELFWFRWEWVEWNFYLWVSSFFDSGESYLLWVQKFSILVRLYLFDCLVSWAALPQYTHNSVWVCSHCLYTDKGYSLELAFV